MTSRSDVTFFTDDDATPLIGTVDDNGAILVASFSTDPSHPRPWLDDASEGVSQEIDLVEGTATTTEFKLTILDKRIVATDQRTGFFTAFLSDQKGYSALTMRRAVFRIAGPDGQMHVAQNGVVSSVKLNSDISSYDISIRDMSERARRSRIFNRLVGPTPRYGAFDASGAPIPTRPSLSEADNTERALPVVRLTLTPATITLPRGTSTVLSVDARNANGNRVALDQPSGLTTLHSSLFTTSNSAVAIPGIDATIHGIGPGVATITLFVDGTSTTMTVTVT